MDVLGDGLERRNLACMRERNIPSMKTRPTPAPRGPLANNQGATYLIVMFLIVLMGISLMAVSQQWSLIMKRDREAELLFRGNRIKEALERYVADYEILKATRPTRYPRKLEDLTKKEPRRYLQVAYQDPITGNDFELIKVGPDIRGVRSTSTDKPLDQVNFKGAMSYQAIRFEVSQSAGCTPTPDKPCTPTTGTPQISESQSGSQIPQ